MSVSEFHSSTWFSKFRHILSHDPPPPAIPPPLLFQSLTWQGYMLLPPYFTYKLEQYLVTVQALLMLPCGAIRAVVAGPALPLHLELQPAIAVLQGF